MNPLRRLILILALVLAIFGAVVYAAAQPQLTVHFLDVGQADSILIQTPNGENMLIDAGNNGDEDFILSYLERLHINRLAVVVGTHPHEDHIGSMDAVIEGFEIGRVYLPKVTTTTRTFASLLAAIKDKGLRITTAKAGMSIELDSALSVEILAPTNESYEELNDYSVVVKLTYDRVAFLFTGDAETSSENAMLVQGTDLQADLIKIAHHGSDTSTSRQFLARVNPKFAVISVGVDNRYAHPGRETLLRLNESEVEVYRTDLLGTIIAVSDGKTIEINQEPVALEKYSPSQTIVYITQTGSKYHQAGCRFLGKSRILIPLSEAKQKGYTPCGVCHPPQ